VQRQQHLQEKYDKLTEANSNQTIQLKAAVDQLSKQEADMRNFKANQEVIQAANDKKLSMMMEKINFMNDNDEQMKNQTKRGDPDTPEQLSTPESKQNLRSKAQKMSKILPKMAALFSKKNPSSPLRTLTAIAETAQGMRHRTPNRQASTSYASETNGGS
jgi:hypothetical protein